MNICPHCKHTLSKQIIHTKSAGNIEIDYCKFCGGIFFDKGEVNRISKADAQKLTQSIHKSNPPHDELDTPSHACPKCGASLKRFYGEAIPNDVYVLRCPECEGTWFEGKELTKFKKAQEAKIRYYQIWKLPLPSLSSVLIPVFLLLILAGVPLITVRIIQKGIFYQSHAQSLVSTPVIIKGEDNSSATIVFSTKEPAKAVLYFTYPDVRGTQKIIVSPKLEKIHQRTIYNLQPSTVYRYRIYVITKENSFSTQTYEFSL